MTLALLLLAVTLQDCIDWSNRAASNFAQGQYAEAEKLWLRALAIPQVPLRAKVASNLAALYKQTEQFDKAELQYRLTHTLRLESLGSNHADTALALNNLAGVHIIRGQYRNAEMELLEALQATGLRTADRAAIFMNLGHVCRLEGRFSEAHRYLEASLPHQTERSIAWNSLGMLAEEEHKMEEARDLFRQSLGKVYRPGVAANLARVELHFGNLTAARQLLLGVLQSQIPELLRAATLETQAALLLAEAKRKDALVAFDQSLALREKVLGPEHPALIPLLKSFAATLHEAQQHKAAIGLEARTRRLVERQPVAPAIDWHALRP